MLNANDLGDCEFQRDYGVRLSYVAGSMYQGISSKELVVKMGTSRLLSFLGTGGININKIEAYIDYIQSHLTDNQPYGCNLLYSPEFPDLEKKTVDLFLKKKVSHIEASAYVIITTELIRYRLSGVRRGNNGQIVVPNSILAKISHPSVAKSFMLPPPKKTVDKLLKTQQITAEAAELSQYIPMSYDICVESDSGGHTSQGVSLVLLPTIQKIRDAITKNYAYKKRIRVGAAGGIGTPEAAAAIFLLDADFILTGSINQCTVEAGTSDMVKNLIQHLSTEDTTHVPAGDMFEVGGKVQVVRRGLLFPGRAQHLYDLYKQHSSIAHLDNETANYLQEKYFKQSFTEIWNKTSKYYLMVKPEVIEKAEQIPKYKMALIFRWYFMRATKMALLGDIDNKLNYQIQCGPALGAFNQWVKNTSIESWRERHVDHIAIMLMNETANYIAQKLYKYTSRPLEH